MTNTDPISDEQLMAYADGELSSDEIKHMREKLEADADLRQRLAAYTDTRAFLQKEYIKVKNEGVPDRFLKIIQSSISEQEESEPESTKSLNIITDGLKSFIEKGFYLPTSIINKLTRYFEQGETPLPSFHHSGFASRGSNKETIADDNMTEIIGLMNEKSVGWFPTEFDTTNDGAELIIAFRKAEFDGDYSNLEPLPTVTIVSSGNHKITNIRVFSDMTGVVVGASVKPRISTDTVSGIYIKADIHDPNLIEIRLSIN